MKRTFNYLCGTGRRAYEMETEKPLYEIVNNETPAGVIAFSAFFGLAVFRIQGDECIAAWTHENGFSGAHRHCIHYSPSGRPFIRKGGGRYYFDEIIAA